MLFAPLASPTARASLALAALALTGLAGGPLTARAQDAPDAMRRVAFQVERTREVANDRLTVIMRVTHDDVEPARLAARINADMGQALERARAAEGVDVRSGPYHTRPIRERQRITGWTGSQDLILTGSDVERLTELAGALQDKLQLASMQFSVSDAARRAVEDELIEELITAYRQRAQLIRDSLGARDHELVRLDLHTNAAPPIPVRFQSATMAKAEAAPAVEEGTTTLTVTASATIELR